MKRFIIGLIAFLAIPTMAVVVCCPPGFYRRTNVKVFCRRHQIKMVDDLNAIADYIRDMVE